MEKNNSWKEQFKENMLVSSESCNLSEIFQTSV